MHILAACSLKGAVFSGAGSKIVIAGSTTFTNSSAGLFGGESAMLLGYISYRPAFSAHQLNR